MTDIRHPYPSRKPGPTPELFAYAHCMREIYVLGIATGLGVAGLGWAIGLLLSWLF